MKENYLEGKTCLVTGSARKLGRAMALACAAAGADVAVHYLSRKEEALKTAKAITKTGRRSIAVKCDVTRDSQVKRMVDEVKARLGNVDVLINNVGDFLLKPLSKVTPAQWHAILASNLHSAFYCARHVLPAMRRRGFGRIVNLGYGPCHRLESLEKCGLYHMAKTALLVYTKAAAKEEAAHGITVNMVSPGTIFTSVNRPSKESIPAGRYASYGDLARAVLFLLKPESDYITGTNLQVTGGKYV